LALLELDHVSFENNGQKILKNISLCIEKGDFISVVGVSGSGKSTLLKLCGHLISPTAGRLAFQGKDFTDYSPIQLRKSIMYYFQSPYLFGDTVMENITFPYSIRNLKYDKSRVEDLFALFHMSTDYLNKEPKNLSGGEKQRIALIRGLIFQPEILLLDEITSALDLENAAIVEDVIASLNQDGITVLWITHNPEQSRKYANKILTIDTGEMKGLEVIK
jgi:putative ABC transport system ATP-binding protein